MKKYAFLPVMLLLATPAIAQSPEQPVTLTLQELQTLITSARDEGVAAGVAQARNATIVQKIQSQLAPKPEAPKPEAPKPEAPKPEAPKPEAPKPEAPKPEAPKRP